MLQEGVEENGCMLLVGEPEGKRPLGKPRCRWLDNIKLDLGERERDGLVWTGLVRLRIGTIGGLL
jgi:hypothetical protein